MGDGLKDYHESVAEAHDRRRAEKISALGSDKVAQTVRRATEHLEHLEKIAGSMSREGWYSLDALKQELKSLVP